MTLTISAGKAGCPCINTTSTLASLTNRYCILPDGKSKGIHQSTLGGSCVPFSFGSNQCLQHDLLYDPRCTLDEINKIQQGIDSNSNSSSTNSAAAAAIVPSFCLQPFCYVDAETCRKNSIEKVYRSSYFAFDSLSRDDYGHNIQNPIFDVDIFYSYSTCNATADDWLKVEEDFVDNNRFFGGIDLKISIPTYFKQYMYKRDSKGIILTERGDEYYNDSIPFEGVYIHYLKQIMEVSDGDITSMTFTHRSKVSDIEHPTSTYTATIQDIADGFIDMAVGSFWVTPQRLRMASFSLPFASDKYSLVIPKPSNDSSLAEEARKVLAPFSFGLWGLLLGVIAVTALLSVWFTDPHANQIRPSNTSRRNNSTNSGRVTMQQLQGTRRGKRRLFKYYGRMALDQCLEKGIFFCSAGVEQDERSSLPTKMLLFGFGFFILIAVSAYVANLAAFLTMSRQEETVKTIDGAIAAGYRICAHPVLSEEMRQAYPEANFYFHEEGRDFLGIMDDYLAGRCEVMAYSEAASLELMCANEVVFTDSVLHEIPIAFPMRQGIASGFNYWMFQAEREGVTLQASKDEFPTQIDCDVYLSEEIEGDEMDAITVKNFFLPIMFFIAFAVAAVLLQIRHVNNVKKGQKSLMGRKSTFDLMNSMRRERKKDDNESDSDRDAYRHYTTTHQRANSLKPHPEEDTFNDNTGGKSIFVGSFEAGASVRGGGDSVVLEGDLALREG